MGNCAYYVVNIECMCGDYDKYDIDIKLNCVDFYIFGNASIITITNLWT